MEVRRKSKIVGVVLESIKSNNNLNGVVLNELLKINSKQKKIKDALDIVGLSSDILKKEFYQLSGGEKQKVLLAKTLLTNKKMMIFENPTNSLDSKSKKNLIKLFKLMKLRYNKNIIIMSNDIEFMHSIVDYVMVMKNGSIFKEGNKYEIFSDSELLEEYGLKVPKLIQFSDLVKKKKKIDIGYRDDINDLIKDIYRFTDK